MQRSWKIFTLLLLLAAAAWAYPGNLSQPPILSQVKLKRSPEELAPNARDLPMPRIVGGVEADRHEFPSIVMVDSASCAGTIIAREWILTAAHCSRFLSLPLHKLKIMAGKHDIAIEKEPNQQIVFVKKYIVHEEFDDQTLYNDVALFKVTPIKYTKYIGPARLPFPGMNEIGLCTVAGWGAQCPTKHIANDPPLVDPDCEQKPKNTTLRKVSVPSLPQKDCKILYPPPYVVKEGTLCAGYVEGGKDACGGDNGGPLYMLKDGIQFLIGIVSWGRGCAQKLYPGVYTRVSHYLDWIRKQVTKKYPTCKKWSG